MIDLIWVFMIITSVVFAVVNENVQELSASLFEGARNAVNLSIALLGAMSFWLGITEIVIKSGLNKKINKVLMPFVNFLFPSFKNNTSLKEKICLNFTANLLGIGNASTPLGLSAIDEMSKFEKTDEKPSKEIILFVLINTASMQILPTQMANLRSNYGSKEPFGILVFVWIVSFTVMFSVIIIAKILEKKNELHS